MSRFCKGCRSQENLKETNPDAYADWRNTHICTITYDGHAGGMETEGAKQVFNRSIDKHKLRYTHFLGDGDSKSFLSVKDVYPDVEVKKWNVLAIIKSELAHA